MSNLLTRLNDGMSRALGLRVVALRDLKQKKLMLGHYRALSEAVRTPLHPEFAARITLLGRLLRPRRATKHRKIRLGGQEDGGYVMLDDLAHLRTAFSLGVGPNVDWDYAMVSRRIDVHQFDHTVAAPPRNHPRFHFHRKKIDTVASAETENLASILKAYGSAGRYANVLKVDIEGSEWPLFANADPDVLARFPQILCEFHALGHVADDAHYHLMIDALRRLRDQFEVVHVHGNNCGGRVFVGERAFPHVLEVTLANRALYDFVDGDEIFPTELDAANDPKQTDYYLGDFDFGAVPDGDELEVALSPAFGEQAAAFDRAAYLLANPDVAEAGHDPWHHWRLFGWGEGRPQSLEEKNFDEEAYLKANPDVAAAGFDALTHWRHFGRPEGRPLFPGQQERRGPAEPRSP